MTDPSFEDLLAAVLREDAQVEPLSGLEERVIRRVIVHRSTRLWKSVRWGLLATSPICLMIAILVSHSTNQAKRPELSASNPAIRAQPATRAQGERGKRLVAPSISLVHEKAKHVPGPNVLENSIEKGKSLPKLDVFPTPTQVLEPVRELADLSFQPGVQISGLNTSIQQGQPPRELLVEPITIAAIEIKPLFPSPNKGKDNIHEH
jgi:hypothetical protein